MCRFCGAELAPMPEPSVVVDAAAPDEERISMPIKIFIAAAVLVIIGSLVIIAVKRPGGPTAIVAPPTHMITGTMELTSADLGGSKTGSCYGTGGFSDNISHTRAEMETNNWHVGFTLGD